MERLTFEGNFCDIAQCRDVPGGSFCEDGSCSQKKVWTRLKSYEDTGLTPKEVTAQGELFDYALKESKTLAEQLTLLKHIRELAEAEKDGRVVVQPCKVGDILYRVFAGEIFEQRVGSMKYFAIQGRWDIETYPFCPCVESSIGKTVFLSREEAEKALQEMEDKKDG
jgi:hypothetical protein